MTGSDDFAKHFTQEKARANVNHSTKEGVVLYSSQEEFVLIAYLLGQRNFSESHVGGLPPFNRNKRNIAIITICNMYVYFQLIDCVLCDWRNANSVFVGMLKMQIMQTKKEEQKNKPLHYLFEKGSFSHMQIVPTVQINPQILLLHQNQPAQINQMAFLVWKMNQLRSKASLQILLLPTNSSTLKQFRRKRGMLKNQFLPEVLTVQTETEKYVFS